MSKKFLKKRDVKSVPLEEMKGLILEMKKELLKLRVDKVQGEDIKNVKIGSILRKNIAYCYTKLKEAKLC